MLRGIAEIVTSQPEEDLKKNCRDKVLNSADAQKQIFDFAERYRTILVDFVEKWNQKKYEYINDKDKILNTIQKLIKELFNHGVISGIFEQFLITNHKADEEAKVKD